EREKWPLDIEKEKLVERQQKITVSFRKNLKKIIRSPDFESWWPHTTDELQNSLLKTVIDYSESTSDQEKIWKRINKLTKGDSVEEKNVAREIEDILSSNYPETYRKLRGKIIEFQEKVSDNFETIVLKEVDNGVVTEPVWFLGPRLIFKQSGEEWLLADIKWSGIEGGADLDIPAFPGEIELYRKPKISRIKEELESKSASQERHRGRIYTTLHGLKIIFSRWTDNHLGFRVSLADLESLSFPPGAGIENNISLIIDRWEDSRGNIHKRKFGSLVDSFRKYRQGSTPSAYLSSRGGAPPEDLRALLGKVNFPQKYLDRRFRGRLFLKSQVSNGEK
ncbi:MAG: hypothetical protein ACQEP7_02160, partial [bacterium]